MDRSEHKYFMVALAERQNPLRTLGTRLCLALLLRSAAIGHGDAAHCRSTGARAAGCHCLGTSVGEPSSGGKEMQNKGEGCKLSCREPDTSTDLKVALERLCYGNVNSRCAVPLVLFLLALL